MYKVKKEGDGVKSFIKKRAETSTDLVTKAKG